MTTARRLADARAGTVYLVGAGPGDPGLLTLRGAELLAGADVVVHDRLSDPALLELAPASAERVDVGKQPDDRGDQPAINQLLIDRARLGLRVVRLKGGDPFVFGRGGEEALALAEANVAYEVVPGVSSAIAAPAYAGVPVTHRGLVTSFTVVAGHSRSVGPPGGQGGTNWEALGAAGGTIVVLMGAAHREQVARRLMAGGLAPATPVAAVQWGTTARQRTVRTTLAGLGRSDLQPPVTMVIGEVAGLHLDWFEQRPLFGRTVVVTRASHQAVELTRALQAAGAAVVELPAITIDEPEDGGVALRSAAAQVGEGRFAWVAFTSANAVHRFFAHVPDTRLLGGTKVAAVGPATADALRTYRVAADLVPEDHRAAGLADAFPAAGPDDGTVTVLLPQAAGAGPALRAGLAAKGWVVETVEAYRARAAALSPTVLQQARTADAICFASPSAVDAYLDQAGREGLPPLVACIGPVTSSRARGRGLEVGAEADAHTLEGLVEALIAAMRSS